RDHPEAGRRWRGRAAGIVGAGGIDGSRGSNRCHAPRAHRWGTQPRRSHRGADHAPGRGRRQLSEAARPAPAAQPHPALSPATLLRRFGPLLGLLLLCGALGGASDRFLTADNLLNILRQSAVNLLVSLGQLVVITTAGI